MGRELYQTNPAFRFWMNHCDAKASEFLGQSLIGVMFSNTDKSKPFDNILFSNPCLLSIEYSVTRMLMEAGLEPEYLLGYSLGEIVAAVIAEAISLEDGLRLAIGIADLARENTPLAKMLAILEVGGQPGKSLALPPRCWITATNFQGNVVVCGAPEGIDELRKRLQSEGKIVQELPVRQGFHTELIDPIEADVKRMARSIRRQKPKLKFPLISCLKAGFVEDLTEQYVWDVIRGEIRFPETIRWLDSQGGFQFIDVGPSGSLANFVKYLLPPDSQSSAWQSLNQFGRDAGSIEKLLGHFSERRSRQAVYLGK